MDARRARMIEEMGLGPAWLLRRGDVQTAGGAAAEPAAEVAAAAGQARAEQAADPAQAAGAQATEAARAARAESRAAAGGGDAGDRAGRILEMDWSALKSAVAGCQACSLAKTRSHTVFGVGDERAEWLLVGEAPGAEEDARGEPFVGQAGRLLDNMLAAIGLGRGSNVYIANVLKCRPPGNRNPEPGEVAQCSPHLLRQIALIRPGLILAMGRFAAQTLLETDASIASLRGKLHRFQGVPLVVTYHPAYLLRSLHDKARAWADLCFARRALADLRRSEADRAGTGN